MENMLKTVCIILNVVFCHRTSSFQTDTRHKTRTVMLPCTAWHALAFLLVSVSPVADSEQGAEHGNDLTPLYLMHLSPENKFGFNMTPLIDFIFEMVNNDTSLLPGYRLKVINGFSQTSVSEQVYVPVTVRSIATHSVKYIDMTCVSIEIQILSIFFQIEQFFSISNVLKANIHTYQLQYIKRHHLKPEIC